MAEYKSTWDTDVSRQTQIKAGTKVRLNYVWAYTQKGEMTPNKDIEITVNSDCILVDALCQVEAAATEFVKSQGASDIRHYYIEDVIFTADAVEFVFGT